VGYLYKNTYAEDTEDINEFELLDLRSPMIKKKISNRGNMRKTTNHNIIG